MLKDAEDYKLEDRLQRQRISARDDLNNYIYNIQNAIREIIIMAKITDEEKEHIHGKCKNVREWLDSNQMVTTEEFKGRNKELKKVCTPITKYCNDAGFHDSGRKSSSSHYSVD